MPTTSRTMDGPHLLADPISQRTLAYGVAVSALVATLIGLPVALFSGLGPALAVSAGAIGVVALLTAMRLMVRAEHLYAKRETTVRIERAAALASSALLKRNVPDPVGAALGALIDGVDAAAVFLETNVNEDPDEHGNAPTVRDVLFRQRPGAKMGNWELTGWRIGPRAQAVLEAGSAHVTSIGELDQMTNAYYRAAGIRSEILVPITAEGRWVGSIGFFASSKSRRWSAAERQLLRSTAETIGAFWERRDAKAKLEELLAAKDEFIASVSHEVRTPLTAVLGFAHELDESSDKFTDQERSDLISLIASQSREVANIVDDLLTAARAEAGTIVIAPQELSVRQVIGEVLSSHSGRVDFVMDEDLELWADGGRVRQILRNLLTNAERYGGSIVKIHSLSAGDEVRIEVRDNGEGIPRHMREQVFEPYARAGNASTQPASIGLGLSVARQLAQMMDGDLELTEEDGWTVFTLTLPATSEKPSPVVAATQ